MSNTVIYQAFASSLRHVGVWWKPDDYAVYSDFLEDHEDCSPLRRLLIRVALRRASLSRWSRNRWNWVVATGGKYFRFDCCPVEARAQVRQCERGRYGMAWSRSRGAHIKRFPERPSLTWEEDKYPLDCPVIAIAPWMDHQVSELCHRLLRSRAKYPPRLWRGMVLDEKMNVICKLTHTHKLPY